MRSSGELLASPQSGHSFLSELIRESLAHSSHIGHPHSGIMMASYKNIVQRYKLREIGGFRSIITASPPSSLR